MTKKNKHGQEQTRGAPAVDRGRGMNTRQSELLKDREKEIHGSSRGRNETTNWEREERRPTRKEKKGGFH